MAALFDVQAASGCYRVVVGEGLLAQRLKDHASNGVILADTAFADQIRGLGLPFVPVTAEEGSKTLTSVAELIAQLRARGLSRNMSLIAVGGGVVQDVASFVASIYMRGVPWVYFPTTLLAMADSCLGGKSSMNVGPYKNLAGTFHPPSAIEVDPSLCATLSADQRVAGLIEAAKICFCRADGCLETYLGLEPGPASDTATLTAVIERSLIAKRWFVETDEFDRDERLRLNFGHTFGHALEAASEFAIPHGLAVGLGILAAGALQRRRGVELSPDSRGARLERHIKALLESAPSLGDSVARLRRSELMAAFRADKKHDRTGFALIAPTAEGRVERLLLPRDDHNEALILAAFAEALAPFEIPPAIRPGGDAPARANRSWPWALAARLTHKREGKNDGGN